jgi:hypothetical protein
MPRSLAVNKQAHFRKMRCLMPGQMSFELMSKSTHHVTKLHSEPYGYIAIDD